MERSCQRISARLKVTIVARPTLLYVISQAVIPAKAGIQLRNTGFRVKPGMTSKVKRLMTRQTISSGDPDVLLTTP